ncbi:MAG: sensor histidine kinase [Dietzia sp.]
MERSAAVQIGAGGSLLVLCLLIGAIEGSAVLRIGTWPVVVLWAALFVVFLVAIVLVTVSSATRLTASRLWIMAALVLGAGGLVTLSPSRGGLAAILLVLTVAAVSLHISPRVIAMIIVWNCAVVLAAGAALGPLVDDPSPPAELFISVVLYALLQAASAATVWSQQRVEQALRAVTVAHVELRGTSALLAESSQARERLRISRELHDVLGHQLTVLSVELEVASHQVRGPGREHVVRARGTARELLADVRAVVGTERGRHIDLPSVLDSVTSEIPHPRVHLAVQPGLVTDDDHAAALVRAVQEIATNTIRHSHAENLRVTLTEDAGVLRLETQDDGLGTQAFEPGNGLRGLRERIEALGGRAEFTPRPGFGVRVELPVQREVQA